MKTYVAGVDISYDLTTYAIVDLRGAIIAKDSFITNDYPNVNDFVAHLTECLVMFFEDHCGYDRIRSVGVSVPSGNFISGSIVNSPNMQWPGEIPLAALLRDRLGLAVALANDAHARALGEFTYGSARGMKDFVLVALGHGLGSTFFSHGRVHLGAEGFGGEVGHSCIVEGGRLCGCGHQGCLEAYCAHNGIIQTAHEVMEESSEPSLMRSLTDLNPMTIKECCDEGDALAIEVYRRAGYLLGIGLANYASVINPEAIILSGGITRAGHWLTDPMEESFEEHVFRNIKGKVKLLPSVLTDMERDVLGASALAWSVKEYSLFI